MTASGETSGGYDLAALLMLTVRSLVDELQDRLAALGFDDVRPAHGFAFVRLTPHGATGAELAEHLGVTKQAVSQMVDYLENHGYVSRHPHERDRREKVVVLTDRGWDCIRATESIFADIERGWSKTIGVEHMEMLRVDLRRIVYAASDGGRGQRLRPIW